MAIMRLILKTKGGEDVLNHDMTGNTYPDVVVNAGLTYILKRLTPDKKNGYYYEVDVLNLAGG